MNSRNLSTMISPWLVVALFLTISGCDKIPTWQELTQQKPEQPPTQPEQPVAKSAPPTPIQSPEPVVPRMEKPDKNALLAKYKSTNSTSFSDAFLNQLESIASDLPEITSLDLLSNPSVTASGLKSAAKLPNLKSVSLQMSRLNDEGLEAITECKTIESLNLTETGITPKGLESLKKLPQLRELHLGGVTIPAHVIDVITEHPELEILGLARTGIDDAGMKAIGQKCVNIRVLNLEGCRSVTDDGIKMLKGSSNIEALTLIDTMVTGKGLSGFKSLRFLDMSRCPLDQPGAAAVHGLPALRELIVRQVAMVDKGAQVLLAGTKLTHLNVSENGLTSEALKKTIKTIKDLEELTLIENPVGDDGIAALKGLKNLKILKIGKTKVSLTAVEDLKKSMPGLQVIN